MSNAVMLGIALFCAAAAALLTRAWLLSQSSQPAPAEIVAAAPAKSIAVAARDIKYGETLSAEAVTLVSWPGDALPKGSFLSVESLIGKDGKGARIALVAMTQGEPILSHKLQGSGAGDGLSDKLSESMKAVTVRVNEQTGVAGLVRPDDRVDVFLTYGGQAANETAPATASSVAVLLQNVRVLAVDQVTQRKDQPTPAKAVTLEVNTEDAQRLILGSRIGEISLALNRVASAGAPETTGAISFEDLLNVERRVRKPGASGGPVVTVTRSTERKDYQVEADKGPAEESWETNFLSHQGDGAAPQR